MPLSRRRFLVTAAASGLVGGGVLAACSRSVPEIDEEDPLRLRVWSEAAAAAYETSLEQFTADTGITVEVEVLGWDEYWDTLPLDVAAESLPDVLWMNTANLDQTITSGQVMELGDIVGGRVGQWEEVATDLYRREDGLWGVPQVFDQSLLVAHDDLLAAAGVDASQLSFDPDAISDPLRDLARQITVDAEGRHPGDDGFDAAGRVTFGFSAYPDRAAVLGPFIAATGGSWQDQEGAFTFASEEGISAVQYLADLATSHLAPDGATTAADLGHCRDLFAAGTLGLLQTGTYDLAPLVAEISGAFSWSVHPVVAGPEGSRPLVHAIAAVGAQSDDDERSAAIGLLLEWLGSVDGQRPLAEARIGVPAHRDLRGAWSQAWKHEGVDVSALEVPVTIARPETGQRSAEGTGAALPIIAEVFTGEADAADALPRAQEAAQSARG